MFSLHLDTAVTWRGGQHQVLLTVLGLRTLNHKAVLVAHPEGELYRRDVDATWQCLMDAWRFNDKKIREARESLEGRNFPLAMTECHFAIPGRDRCDVLSTWAAGVSYGRILNNHQRHGDLLKVATAADFCGTRWQVNALKIPVPGGDSYLMPVARVMKLYRHHIGKHAVKVARTPDDWDVVASRTEGDWIAPANADVVHHNWVHDIQQQATVSSTTPVFGNGR